MKTFGGPALFLDRSDINTDEIIPAKYLTEITKEDLKPYILEDLKLPGFDPKEPKKRNRRGSSFPAPTSAAARPANMPPGCLRSTASLLCLPSPLPASSVRTCLTAAWPPSRSPRRTWT